MQHASKHKAYMPVESWISASSLARTCTGTGHSCSQGLNKLQYGIALATTTTNTTNTVSNTDTNYTNTVAGANND